MKLLFLHTDFIDVKVKEKALKEAEENPKDIKENDALVVFTAIENDDTINSNVNTIVNKKAVKEILDVSNKVNAKNIVIYPYVHLSSKPAKPRDAFNTLQSLEKLLKEALNDKNVKVSRAPFGWYKAFTISVKGHPLSELSREIKADEKEIISKEQDREEISESLKKESSVKSVFYILNKDGTLYSIESFDFSHNEQLKKLVEYETKKSRVYEKEPPHIKIMQEHELVDYEPGSDPGNFRYYPKGRLIKKILERYISNICLSYGANEVETPLMYDFEHPALKKYLNRFPARQYLLLSDEKRYFLRFAACFGQFLIAHDAVISYKQLPLKLYELTRYSFRREQSGELAGLKRLRAFTMPDMHTLVKDIEMAKKEFENQLHVCIDFLKSTGLFEYTEVAFRVEQNFFNENKEWYKKLVNIIGKPIMIEMFNERYAYFITKFEFNFIDAMNKASALSTVQIDVENSERFDISFIDENGNKQRPLILHASISGAVERVIYALLEKQAMLIEKGKKASLPVWLSPTQVRVIPINEKNLNYALEIAKHLIENDIRADIDDKDETLGNKIRRAQKEWIPYIVVIGNKEEETKTLSVTIRENDEKKTLTLNELTEIIKKDNIINERINMPILLSKRPIFRQSI
jgi:threonyl-tRNA synthetase